MVISFDWEQLTLASKADTHSLATGGSHLRGIPRRVPDDVDVDFIDLPEIEQGVVNASADAFMHRAAGRRERHGHPDFPSLNLDVVDQTQINDVAVQRGIRASVRMRL